ncbi:formate dehydrogenase accessory sulfurtransferase FdhD [Xylophilus ampelinus]|uniref:Sulfur carrier protein FdhD n=1 Tax=Xylophilus ampelinus TaxID=54067 RepID=A0A318SDT9_9BURK|nr:formate dehydrogenase accessory sulfurtransferase FdhD [Xylophilus ampelinus]MCS4511378.1 formate dehydrogenase accessory sulfurtransferase FdhD [Xylophilus ampelinus]PYE74866.1 FdhD protein [Xylophilus ampelinus]
MTDRTPTFPPDGTALPPALLPAQVQRQRLEAGAVCCADDEDRVANEVPVALVFNGISHAVMMCTPQDLEAFALGFALSEGILDTRAECFGVETRRADCAPAPDGGGDPETPAVEVHLEIASRAFARLKERRRALVGRTGCGVCGIDSLAALDLVPEQVPRPDWLAAFDARTVLAAFDGLAALQPLNAQVGSLHAAGWARPDGTLTDVLEDVGRHNALDKLLGRLAEDGRLGTPGFVVMSSRASYELARKCARLGVPVLATISAPTALAIGIARQAGMQLWGLCRGPRALRYAGGG